MQLAPSLPRPASLAPIRATPPIDLARDAAPLAKDDLPEDIRWEVNLGIVTTAEDEFGPITDWYAGISSYSDSYRVNRSSFADALAATQALQASNGQEAMALVQAKDGARYAVPLAVWNPADESELSFDDVGGLPHWNGATDHVLLRRNEGAADVEAVVFGAGDEWVNLTGHPVRLPSATA